MAHPPSPPSRPVLRVSPHPLISGDSREGAYQRFRSLEDWLDSDEILRVGLDTVELGTEERGREILRLALQDHIDRRGPGDVGPGLEVGQGKGAFFLPRRRSLRPRKVATIFGAVHIRRYRYTRRQGPSVHPLDEQLHLPLRSYSYEIQRRLVKRAVQGPFQEAIDDFREPTSVSVPKRSAQQIVVDASEDVDLFYAQRAGSPQRNPGPILVAAIDCKGIPMVKPERALRVVRRGKGKKANKKRMATVGAVFTMEPRPRTPEEVVASLFDGERGSSPHQGPEDKRVWASLLASKDAFVQEMVAEVNRRDPGRQKTHVVLSDGERALQLRMGKAMPGAVVVLDLIHAVEKLWAVAYVIHPEGSPEAKEFVRERTLRILKGGVGQVVKGLRQMVTKRRLRGSRQQTLLSVAAYLHRNRSRMRYNIYLAQGLPIASGSVEGACKNLIKDRMERSGMRWSLEGAEAMVKLRAVYLSKDFEEYWGFHVEQEQLRLYPPNHWKTNCAPK